MTVDSSSKRPLAEKAPSQLRRRTLLFLLLVASSVGLTLSAAAQRPSNGPPPWADTTGESNVYPVGDAVGVYRAVLDLLYVDGKERPPMIVMWDAPMRHGNGPCPWEKCAQEWTHKSKMDTTAVLALVRQSAKRPRIVDFGYRIPIVHVSDDAFQKIRNDGYGFLADSPPDKVGPVESFWAGFRRTYPRAWGYVMLSKVGFNTPHNQALIAVFQVCGENCRSNEIIFLKRFRNEWKVIERIPDYAQAWQTSGNLRYRGPAGETQDQSQIIATDALGSQPRAESVDASAVYSAVLDKLYSFYGERPRSIVIAEAHGGGWSGLEKYRSRIDTATISSYNLLTHLYDAMPRFRYRIPITWVSDTALKDIERESAPLAKAAGARFEPEQSALWLGFHAKYPSAWGYATLGRVGFNAKHTQALVYTRHFCGTYCVSGDTWFLERKGERWYVVERIPRETQNNNYMIDGLRYLGTDADPKAYRTRRIHGVFTDFQTGEPLPRLEVEVKRMGTSFFTRTDSEGRYSLENEPLGGISLMVKCPPKFGGKWLFTVPVPITPGIDSTVNVKVDFTACPQE